MPSGHLPDDLTGQKFGRWTMLYRHDPQIPSIPGKAVPWRCRCDCGHEQDLLPGPLKKGYNCRCKECEIIKLKDKRARHQEWVDIQKSLDIVSKIHIFRIKKNAVLRKINFSDELTVKYLSDLARSQKQKCKFTGEDLYFEKKGRRKNGNASLDRICSSGSYEPGNVQWVTKRVNVMKGTQTDAEFIAMCRVVVAHQDAKEKG